MQDHDDAYRLVRATYSVAHMSDAKWVRLFNLCIDSGVTIDRAVWRFIDREHVLTSGLPRAGDLLPTRFADGRFQPVEYKWILSIFVPRVYRVMAGVGATRPQDVARLRAALEGRGSFPLVEREDGLTLVAYE